MVLLKSVGGPLPEFPPATPLLFLLEMAGALTNDGDYLTSTVPNNTGDFRTLTESWRGACVNRVWDVQQSLGPGALQENLPCALDDWRVFSITQPGPLTVTLYRRQGNAPPQIISNLQYFVGEIPPNEWYTDLRPVTVAAANGQVVVLTTVAHNRRLGNGETRTTYLAELWWVHANGAFLRREYPIDLIAPTWVRQGQIAIGLSGRAAVFYRTDRNMWLRYTQDYGQSWQLFETGRDNAGTAKLNRWLAITEGKFLYFGYPRFAINWNDSDPKVRIRVMDLSLEIPYTSPVAVPSLEGWAVLSASGSVLEDRLVVNAVQGDAHKVVLLDKEQLVDDSGLWRSSALGSAQTCGAVSPNGLWVARRTYGTRTVRVEPWSSERTFRKRAGTSFR